ncbi:MAG: hypothetical protein QOH21_2429 [Acidobacteriota bacterium]|jgi:hypothetical protein|nr:hypothetical protein [Acidobacteriota bacterium]
MAKNPSTAVRERAEDEQQVTGAWVHRDSVTGRLIETKLLFPTEPSTIGRKKIDRAIARVIADRKK